MAITYEWNFNFDVNNSDNIVKTIHWRYNGVDGEHSATMYGSCNGADMPYDTMTKDQCISCVLENSEQTEEDMKSNLSNQIDELKTPTITKKQKEW